MTGVRVHHPTLVLHGHNTAMVSDLTGQVAAEEPQGLFCGDTRLISSYKFDINGCAWRLLGRSRMGHHAAQWQFENRDMRDGLGELPGGSISMSLRRRIAGALHDDIAITSFVARPVRLRLILQLDADFADIFEVKARSMPPRMSLARTAQDNGLVLAYERGDFRRALHARFSLSGGAAPSHAGSRVSFDIALAHGQTWRCCVEAEPELDGDRVRFIGDPHGPEPDPVADSDRERLHCDPILRLPFERGRADLHALKLDRKDTGRALAAGAPWFLALFGRDALVTALMSGIDGIWSAEMCLDSLGRYQGKKHDDFRDEQPGKIPHELRRDELTRRGELPYSPYYGTHDAPSLYCLTLWNAWRWSGDRALLEAHFETAWRAMRWCEEFGDRDQDGLQEYATRSRKGYRNQGWKDAGDAVVDARGRQASLPLATVELQGYLYAARLALAELCTELGRNDDAGRLLRDAAKLRRLVEERFWLESDGYYAFALDGDKNPVDGISSNPGHLLWAGLPSAQRAARMARRLLAPDMFSGWGIRSLSADNPAYNPLSYQLGSVWPHDTLIASAGLWRYGWREEASRLILGVLRAADAFEEHRLPELFCGLDASCGFPVPYEQANIPQAWSAAVPLLIAQLFVGFLPDAPRRRCFISPWLPAWLPELQLENVKIGAGTAHIKLRREGRRTVVTERQARDLEIIEADAQAPLWGAVA